MASFCRLSRDWREAAFLQSADSLVRELIEALPHGDPLFDRVAEGLAKTRHVNIGPANLEIDLRTTQAPQARLRHHRSTKAVAAQVRGNREMIDPAPIAVVANHNRRHDS
jgi:hypothetical protein